MTVFSSELSFSALLMLSFFDVSSSLRLSLSILSASNSRLEELNVSLRSDNSDFNAVLSCQTCCSLELISLSSACRLLVVSSACPMDVSNSLSCLVSSASLLLAAKSAFVFSDNKLVSSTASWSLSLNNSSCCVSSSWSSTTFVALAWISFLNSSSFWDAVTLSFITFVSSETSAWTDSIWVSLKFKSSLVLSKSTLTFSYSDDKSLYFAAPSESSFFNETFSAEVVSSFANNSSFSCSNLDLYSFKTSSSRTVWDSSNFLLASTSSSSLANSFTSNCSICSSEDLLRSSLTRFKCSTMFRRSSTSFSFELNSSFKLTKSEFRLTLSNWTRDSSSLTRWADSSITISLSSVLLSWEASSSRCCWKESSAAWSSLTFETNTSFSSLPNCTTSSTCPSLFSKCCISWFLVCSWFLYSINCARHVSIVSFSSKKISFSFLSSSNSFLKLTFSAVRVSWDFFSACAFFFKTANLPSFAASWLFTSSSCAFVSFRLVSRFSRLVLFSLKLVSKASSSSSFPESWSRRAFISSFQSL